MATKVLMKHPQSGSVKIGFYGFSWTTLLWLPFPALFRGDFPTFVVASVAVIVAHVVLSMLSTLGASAFGVVAGLGVLLAQFLFAFHYNKYYTTRLLNQGYEFADDDANVRQAKANLGLALA